MVADCPPSEQPAQEDARLGAHAAQRSPDQENPVSFTQHDKQVCESLRTLQCGDQSPGNAPRCKSRYDPAQNKNGSLRKKGLDTKPEATSNRRERDERGFPFQREKASEKSPGFPGLEAAWSAPAGRVGPRAKGWQRDGRGAGGGEAGALEAKRRARQRSGRGESL